MTFQTLYISQLVFVDRINFTMTFTSSKATILPITMGFIGGAISMYGLMYWHRRSKRNVADTPATTVLETVGGLHWNPLEERRGLGDLIVKANHIAIIVSDVGRSLSFYVDILGLQQIRRPNFDRHGAWLTMGNIELHLIKGVPVPPCDDNLIVGHISLETEHVDLVLQKLRDMNIQFRQNISVPDSKKSRANRFEGHEGKQSTGVIQYFFTDPDGYYIEICNCDILTAFCLNKEKKEVEITYHEGIQSCRALDVVHAALRWKRKAFIKRHEDIDSILADIPCATELNQERFENLCKRRFSYGDIMQGFTDEEIKEALLQTHNFVPLAIKILTEKRGTVRYYQPPSFYEQGELKKPASFNMSSNYKKAT